MSIEPAITPRPPSLPSETRKVRTACGDIYLTNSTDSSCWEFKIEASKFPCAACLEAMGNFITYARRKPNPLSWRLIIKCLKGIRCLNDSGFLPSCPQAIALTLEEIRGIIYENGTKEKEEAPETPAAQERD